ncbi:hypothetical protein [Nocardioides sp.]|uniref:hypothetical protein n=1 Tax=Nocardioides sp. TaxID=35761 RepID=UPI002721E7EB|nr:hypothetical protein [Nocardioides sp.]MDO9454492.1 hypothetical protein [Nocardioides sp.]
MIRLIGVELTRLRWRRAVLLMLAAMLVVPVVIAVIALVDQQPLGPDAYAQAEQQAAEEAKQPYVQEGLQACLDDPVDFGVAPGEDAEQVCRDYNVPTADQFLDYNPLDLAQARDDSGLAVAVIVGLIALLVGTTFAGHDWNTGSMSNQLLFETRRVRVWSAKAVAVVLVTGVVAAIGSTVFWLMIAARFWLDDLVIPDGVLLDSLQQGWRGAGVAALGALGGFALTMLSRSTVFTLGVLFGVSVAGGILISLLVDDPGWIDPTVNAAAVIEDGKLYYVDVPESCYADASGSYATSDSDCFGEKTRSLGDGLIYLGLLSAAISGASVASYRRRDVP